jgi:hypothetical protein
VTGVEPQPLAGRPAVQRVFEIRGVEAPLPFID